MNEVNTLLLDAGYFIRWYGPILFTGMISVIGFFFVRTLRQIDSSQRTMAENQGKMCEKLDLLSKDFYELRGEHLAYKSYHLES